MTALSTARMTGLQKTMRTMTASVAAAVIIYKGALCGFKAGYLVPWTNNDPTIKHPCIAIPADGNSVDNSGGAAGDLTCDVDFFEDKILYLFANDGVSPIVQANIGGSAWGIDDQTVSADSNGGNRSRVGTPWIVQGTNARGYRTGVYVELDGGGGEGVSAAVLAGNDAGEGASLVGVQDSAGRFTATNVELVLAEIGSRIAQSVADNAALAAIPASARADGQIVIVRDTDTLWAFDSASVAVASDWVVVPGAGTGRWLRIQPSLADLASTANGKGASLIGIEDAAILYAASNVEQALAEVKLLADDAIPSAVVQSGTGTLGAGGTVTIASATITASSRIFVNMTDPGAGAITGFASLRVSNKVVGAPGSFDVTAIDDAKAAIVTAVCVFDWLVINL